VSNLWYIKKCERCGKQFNAIFRGPGTKYCEECSKIVRKEKMKKAREVRKMRGKSNSKKPKIGDKCRNCGYNIIHALEYSHEIGDFLCANCHSALHGKRGNISMNDFLTSIIFMKCGNINDFLLPYRSSGLAIILCFLCLKKEAIEKHHIILRSEGMYPIIIPLCPNCHRIVTKFEKKWFKDWYEKYYKNNYSVPYETLIHYSDALLAEVKAKFYCWLRENWSKIEDELRRSNTRISLLG